jgi:O-methyltransferase domain/Dimerisation domain
MTPHDQPQEPHAIPPPVALLQLVTGYWVSQAIYVAAKLGLADVLQDGPKRCDELAQATATHARSLSRLLRALASVGVFAEVEPDRFGLTPLAALLQTGVPGSLRALAIFLGEPEHWRPWGNLLHSVQTGQTAFDHTFGLRPYEYLAQYPAAAEIFHGAMTEFTTRATGAITTAYDFSQFGQLVDVGGGHGALLTAILQANATMRGVLFDLPAVVAGARARIEAAGLAGRCEVVAGDFFESVPSGGDAYLLKGVIVDWDDAPSVRILTSCSRAMAAQGKLLVVDMVIPPRPAPFWGPLADLEMLVVASGGRARTEAEFGALFTAAGFKLTRVVPTGAPLPSDLPFSILEGVRA